ncbi:putative reverse transcriptase domain-containing protein [Tanacetum coccineum]
MAETIYGDGGEEVFLWLAAITDESFEELKRRLVSAPILTLPSGSGGFQIYSDASKKGFGLCFDATMGRALGCLVYEYKGYSGGYRTSMRNRRSNLNYRSKRTQRDDSELWAIVDRMVKNGKHTEFSLMMTVCLVLKIAMRFLMIRHLRESRWRFYLENGDRFHGFVTGLPTTQQKT